MGGRLPSRCAGAGGVLWPVQDEFSATVVFESEQTYDANSNSPEQSAWYEEFRKHIVDDPEWFNGNLEVQTTS